MDFKTTLKWWQDVEKAFAKKLIDWKLQALEFAPEGQFKDWDLKVRFKKGWKIQENTFEIKRDFKSQETWNIALEYRCNWEPSGIYASKADYIVFCLENWEFYYQDRWELLYRISNINKYSTCWWDWDRAEMYIIKKEFLPMLFKKL